MALQQMRWLIATLLFLVVWPGTTHGQSSALMDVHNRTKELYAQGRYEEALPFAEKSVELGEQEFGTVHPTTATLLNILAELYLAQGRYTEAEPLHKRALAIREKTLGPEHPHVAASLENYAALLRKMNRVAEAVTLEDRAKVIRAKNAKENP